MKKVRSSMFFVLILISNQTFAQKYIDYNPEFWSFKAEIDLIDYSIVRAVTTELLNIKDNKEVPVSETTVSWNSTRQLFLYRFIDLQVGKNSFEVFINHEDAYSNPIKTVEISEPETNEILEEWEFEYGPSLVKKINVKRHIPGTEKIETFEVIYDGDEEDYTQETVYTPKKTILEQTKSWYHYEDNTGYRLVKRKYLGDARTLVQTDSLIHNENYLKQEHYQTKDNKTTATKYIYKSLNVYLDGEEYEGFILDSLKINGENAIRYEYEYDEIGNWIVRKNFEMKNGKWEYSSVVKRIINYTM